MRKRPVILAAAALAAGLAVLGTVDAQTPASGGASPGKVAPSGAMPPPPVRPYSEWTPTPPPAGYTPKQPTGGVAPAGGVLPPPAGYNGQGVPGQGNRPRLTSPVIAGPDGVRPASGSDIPPPSMDITNMVAPPVGGGSLPPPNVTQEPRDVRVPVAPSGVDPTVKAPPLFPPGTTPPAGGGTGGVPPLPPDNTPPGISAPPLPIVPIGPTNPVQPIPPLPPIGGTGAGTTPAPVGTLPPLPIPGHDRLGSRPTPPVMHASPALGAKTTQTVTLEAVCPESVVFGAEFRYELIIRNSGTGPVMGVRVEDEIPAGAKYVGSDPPAEMNGDRLVWSVGTLDANGEKRIAVRMKPSDEGELRSRATVSYSAAVDARTKVTRPRVAVSVTGGELCKAGEETIFTIKVTNSGTGPAQQMVLQALLSDGLSHPQGLKLEMAMANLPPGETKTIPLKVIAGKAGLQGCQVTVTAQGSPDSITKASVNVVEPRLEVAQTGPAKCLVRGSEPVYEITLSNPGTAATDAITLYSVLPEGFEYVQASDTATFNATNRAVVWKHAGLAPGSTKSFSLKLRASVAGDGLLRTIAQAGGEQPVQGAGATTGAMRPASKVLEAKTETAIKAEGVAAVRFDVQDLDDPVEAGKEAVYEIRVMNQGTGACTNVQLVAQMAEGTQYTGSSGPTQIKAQGQQLVFEPIPTLGVKGEAVYRVKVRGTVAGDLRFRVQLTCDQVRTPVVKEESTRFYKE